MVAIIRIADVHRVCGNVSPGRVGGISLSRKQEQTATLRPQRVGSDSSMFEVSALWRISSSRRFPSQALMQCAAGSSEGHEFVLQDYDVHLQ